MAIVKLSKSGNGVTFVDDFGNTYGTSKTYLMALVSGRMKAPFTELVRYPMPAAGGRFKKSPVLGKEYEKIPVDDPRWSPPQCDHNTIATNSSGDALGAKETNRREETKLFSDKKVDW